MCKVHKSWSPMQRSAQLWFVLFLEWNHHHYHHQVMNIMFHFDSISSNRSSLCHGPLIRDSHPGVQVSLSPEHLHPQTSLLSSDTNPLYSFSFHTVPHLSESRIPRLHFHDMESLVNWIVSVWIQKDHQYCQWTEIYRFFKNILTIKANV